MDLDDLPVLGELLSWGYANRPDFCPAGQRYSIPAVLSQLLFIPEQDRPECCPATLPENPGIHAANVTLAGLFILRIAIVKCPH